MAEEPPARPVVGINDLPLDILRSVLSLLSARDVVRTCVQSRLWRDLWKSVPRINAAIFDFECDGRSYQQSDVLFKRFMNHFLEARGPVPLQDFRLWYRESEEDEEAQSGDANAWIRYALQQDALLIVGINRLLRYYLAPDVFTSKYLKVLQLSRAVLVQGFFRQLSNYCPELKALFLSGCRILDTNIYSETIEVLSLTITGLGQFPERDGDQPGICIPSLISLILHSRYGPGPPLLKSMESLEEAWIISRNNSKLLMLLLSDSFSRAFLVLEDWNSIIITECSVEKNYQWCPTFSNLTDLTLHEWCVHEDFYAFIVFLQKSPNLKKLTLILRPLTEQFGVVPSIIGQLEERSFTCSQLEGVEIVCLKNQCSMLPKVRQFLLDGGITTDKIHIAISTGEGQGV